MANVRSTIGVADRRLQTEIAESQARLAKMGTVRYAAAGNNAVRIGDADRRPTLESQLALRHDADSTALSVTQARLVERCRMLAGRYAAATTDGERASIADELRIARKAVNLSRTVKGPAERVRLSGFAGLMALAALTRFTVVDVALGMVFAGRDANGNPLYRYVEPPVGATEVCRRRWLKHPRTSQTQLYAAEPYRRRGIDGITRTEPGSYRRVGNVPSGLIPPSLREIADMMTPGF